MRKDFGKKNYFFPLPVCMIATYDEKGTVDVMNAAWGGICDYDLINVFMSSHKTTDNLKIKKAFTLSFATKATAEESDFFGMVSGKDDPKKFEKTGFHAKKSEHVDAPIIEEYPLTLECVVEELQGEEGDFRLVGRVVNCSADESILSEGKVDMDKLEAIAFDPASMRYLLVKGEVGRAFSIGKKFR